MRRDGTGHTEDPLQEQDDRTRIMGLGATTLRKTYYPELQRKLRAYQILEDQYRRVVENASDGILLLERDTIRLANRRSAEMLGHFRESLIGRTLSSLLPLEAWLHLKDRLRRLQSPTEQEPPALDLNLSDPQGGERWVLIRFRRVHDDQDPSPQTLLFLSDRTAEVLQLRERHRLEVKLRQTQKLEAIGTLAGGIAHDFNNILGAIVGFTELSIRETEDEHPVQKNLQQIRTAAERARKLVARILTFSKPSDAAFTLFSLQDAVNETISLARSALPATIRIEQECLVEDSRILGDPTQINQVLMNLITNAMQAMPRGGRLSLSLLEKPEGMLLLSVGDTGTGIPPEYLERIYDPFFTTKKRGEGTGLGLSMVHAIVLAHQGDIQVSSQAGRGTRFDLTFPLARSGGLISIPQPTDLPQGEGECIMVVDDEPMLITIISRMLLHLNYRVLSFANPREALAALTQSSEPVDLLITDQTMPEQTGTQLAQVLFQLRPEVPVLICTGLAQNISESGKTPPNVRGILPKPVRHQALARAVARIFRPDTLGPTPPQVPDVSDILLL